MTPQRYQRRHTRTARLLDAERWQRRRIRPHNGPEAILASIPSLPRPALERLAQRIIDRLDDLDGDPDAEDGDEDRCPSWDDDHISDARPIGQIGFDPIGAFSCEDAEDDDPGGGNVEDEGQINEIAPYTGPLDPSCPWPPRCA
ncbi:MAG: hypothetical protein U5M50_11065 [Sphingobium sp.]|nr:hypothetical protein [Sphingobium sp.]